MRNFTILGFCKQRKGAQYVFIRLCLGQGSQPHGGASGQRHGFRLVRRCRGGGAERGTPDHLLLLGFPPGDHPAPNTSACIQLPHLRKPFSGAYLRPSAYPATGNALPVPNTPSARLLIQPRTPERLHPASPPVKAIFGRIFAPVSSFKPRLL